MGPSFRSGHLLPPDHEDFSFSGSIAERRTIEKMGWSHAYGSMFYHGFKIDEINPRDNFLWLKIKTKIGVLSRKL
jgi:hypothetical protein